MASGWPWKAITDMRPSSGSARGATFMRPIENWPLAITRPARRSSTAAWASCSRAGVLRVATRPLTAAAIRPGQRPAQLGEVAPAAGRVADQVGHPVGQHGAPPPLALGGRHGHGLQLRNRTSAALSVDAGLSKVP